MGMWLRPEHLDNALRFFCDHLGFAQLSRSPRKGGGERVFLGNEKSHYLELLVCETVQQPAPMELHPAGRFEGIAHAAFSATNLPDLCSALAKEGFEVLRQIPPSFEGYVSSEMGQHRIAFVRGPGNLCIELFEFQKSALPLP